MAGEPRENYKHQSDVSETLVISMPIKDIAIALFAAIFDRHSCSC